MRWLLMGVLFVASLGSALVVADNFVDQMECANRWQESGYEFRALPGACTVNIGGGWLPEESVTVTHYRTGR